MEKKKINYGLIIFVLIIVVLFIPIISDYIKSRKIEVIPKETILEKISNKESFLLYFGDTKKVKKELLKLRDKTLNDYSYQYGVYSSDQSINSVDEKVVMYIEGDIQKSYTKFDYEALNEDVTKFLVADLNDNNRSYNIAENFSAYKKIVKSDLTTMAVFGTTDCYHCNRFKPVYNSIAGKYDLDTIYYFDAKLYNSNELKKILNLDLTVPAKCSSDGNEFKLANMSGTPLTIFTKNGKVIDCLGGYVNRDRLITKLKELKMISE